MTTNGNGRIRMLVQIIGIGATMAAIVVPAWVSIRVQQAEFISITRTKMTADSARIVALSRKIDSVITDSRRFQIVADRAIRDLSTRLPPRPPR